MGQSSKSQKANPKGAAQTRDLIAFLRPDKDVEVLPISHSGLSPYEKLPS